MGRTKITAHSGAMGTEPNSLEFIRKAVEIGADCLEIDLNRFEEVLVLSHNTPTTMTVPVTALFDELLDTQMMVNCDCKVGGTAAAVVALAEQRGFAPGRIFFTGCVSPEELPTLHGAGIYLNLEGLEVDTPEQAVEICQKSGTGLNVDFHSMTPELREQCRAAGVPVTVWTVDRPEVQQQMIALGVTTLTTNRPDTAMAMVK